MVTNERVPRTCHSDDMPRHSNGKMCHSNDRRTLGLSDTTVALCRALSGTHKEAYDEALSQSEMPTAALWPVR